MKDVVSRSTFLTNFELVFVWYDLILRGLVSKLLAQDGPQYRTAGAGTMLSAVIWPSFLGCSAECLH